MRLPYRPMLSTAEIAPKKDKVPPNEEASKTAISLHNRRSTQGSQEEVRLHRSLFRKGSSSLANWLLFCIAVPDAIRNALSPRRIAL